MITFRDTYDSRKKEEESLADIKRNERVVAAFLDELIETVSTYIIEQKYKIS